MSKLQKVIHELGMIEQAEGKISSVHQIDARAKLLVLGMYLLCMLSLPPYKWPQIILYLAFPVVTCIQAHIPYGRLFMHSLMVLPFIVLVGIFNPWPSFVGIMLRGIASAQAVFILIRITGFNNLCRGMLQLGIPSLLVSQLLFVYRYLTVLLQEALTMEQARKARSYGRSAYPFKQWGIFVGQLLLRTLDRSQDIHRAMLSRGFNGTMSHRVTTHWEARDSGYLLGWTFIFLTIRFIHIPSVL